MKIGFVHPDLGIGGAEKLIIQMATLLQSNKHKVTVYTSHYSTSHCFPESLNLDVRVHGDFFPTNFYGYFHVFFSVLRTFYLAFYMLYSGVKFDLLIVDQVPFSIPVLKLVTKKV